MGWDPGLTFIDGGGNHPERKNTRIRIRRKRESNHTSGSDLYFFVCVSETPTKIENVAPMKKQ